MNELRCWLVYSLIGGKSGPTFSHVGLVPFVSYHYIFSLPNSEHVQVDDQKKTRKSTLKVHFSPIRPLNCMYICLVHLLAALCSAALSNSIVGAENTKQRKACNQFENQANIFHQNVPSTTFLWAGPPAFSTAVAVSLSSSSAIIK